MCANECAAIIARLRASAMALKADIRPDAL
jgi:hypothetical protein